MVLHRSAAIKRERQPQYRGQNETVRHSATPDPRSRPSNLARRLLRNERTADFAAMTSEQLRTVIEQSSGTTWRGTVYDGRVVATNAITLRDLASDTPHVDPNDPMSLVFEGFRAKSAGTKTDAASLDYSVTQNAGNAQVEAAVNETHNAGELSLVEGEALA